MNSDIAGRPVLIKGKSQILFGSMGRLSENSVINIKNKSHSVTAEIVVPATGAVEGVIVAQGGNIGGWSLYAKGGKLKYCYNFLGIHYFLCGIERPAAAQASTRSAWSLPTRAGVSVRAVLQPCSSMASRSARARSPLQRPWSSRATTVAMLALTTGLPFHRTTALAATSSRVASKAFNSRLLRTPKASTTSSRRRKLSA